MLKGLCACQALVRMGACVRGRVAPRHTLIPTRHTTQQRLVGGFNLCCVPCASPCVCVRQCPTSVLCVVRPRACCCSKQHFVCAPVLCLLGCACAAAKLCLGGFLQPGALVLLPIACVSTEPVMLRHRCLLVLFCSRMGPSPGICSACIPCAAAGAYSLVPCRMVSADTICDDHIRWACLSVRPVWSVSVGRLGGGSVHGCLALFVKRTVLWGEAHSPLGCFGRFVYLVAALHAGFD